MIDVQGRFGYIVSMANAGNHEHALEFFKATLEEAWADGQSASGVVLPVDPPKPPRNPFSV